MTRYLFLLVNIFPLLFLLNTTEIKKDELKVEIDAPASTDAGSSFVVTLTFSGGEVKSFAKYIDVLPAGCTAEEVDLGDATFTADNGQIKILWIDFPQEEVITVKYKINVSADATSPLEMGGKFSYIENNEKKVYSVFKKNVTIGGAANAVIAQAEAPKEVSVKVERRIIQSKENVYNVQLTVTQSGVDGFGKIQEFVPFGSEIEKGEVENAAYSYVKNKVKFVWMSVPAKESYTVDYFVDLSNADSKDIKSITGTFSYLDNDVTKKVDVHWGTDAGPALAVVSKPVEPEVKTTGTEENNTTKKEEGSKTTTTTPVPTTAVAATTPKKEEKEEQEVVKEEKKEQRVMAKAEVKEDKEETKTEEKVEKVEEKIARVEEEDKSSQASNSTSQTSNANAGPVTASAGSNQGVVYRVQIAAGKNVVGQEYFKKRHNFETDFSIENHQGWVKYTTGSYTTYRTARDSRQDITDGGHKFDGPFVTAYSNGSRITVQEALMISNQKWYK